MSPGRLRSVLRRLTPRALALFAALLCVPGLFTGLSLDDHWFRANLLGTQRFGPVLRPPWDLFTFYHDASTTRFLRDLGVAPWWTDLELRIRFCRPLASLTHWLDARLLGGSALAQHGQSLLWYALLVGLVAALLRRVSSSRLAAALGAGIFAAAAGHSAPATWVSNRNAIVSTTFAVLAIGVHVAAARRGRTGGALLAAACFALALASGEMAVGAAGFFFAAELTLATDSRLRRSARLAPHALVCLVWAALYRGLSMGVRGSGMYVDPSGDLAGYLSAVPGRFAALFGASLFGLPPELYSLTPPGTQPLVALAGLGLGAGVVWLFREPLRRAPSARFFLLAFSLASLPACGTYPAGRLVVLASVAGAGLLGEGLAALARQVGRPGRLAFAVLALLHGPFAVLGFVASTFGIDAAERRLARASRDLDELGLASAECVVFAHAPMLVNGYLLAQRESHGLESPRATLNLSATDRRVRIARAGPAALSLEAPDGFYAEGDIGMLTRSLSRPFGAGTVVEHPCGRLTIESVTARGVPSRLRFDAASAELPLLDWVGGRFVRLPWPAPASALERAGGTRI